jgi:hypothetical protein
VQPVIVGMAAKPVEAQISATIAATIARAGV